MRVIALLSARASDRDGSGDGSTPPAIRLGIQSSVEYQARQAILAGAEELVIHLDAPDAGLKRIADRLARETEVPISLVSDGPDLARLLRNDDHVLILAEHMVVPQDAIALLLRETAPALLVTPTVPATLPFERIDGQHVWAGAALLPAAIVLSTIDMLGDWDLVLTLLRRAVQQDARRVLLSPELVPAARLLLLRDQADADRALAAQLAGSVAGGGLAKVLAPISRRLVTELARRQVAPVSISLGAGVCAIAGVAAASGGWAILALLLALLAEAALFVSAASVRAMLRPSPAPWLALVVEGAGLAVLAVIGGRLAQGQILALAGVGLPLALVAVLSHAQARRRIRPDWGNWRVWMRPTVVMALSICLVGSVLGSVAEAFVLIGLLVTGVVAVQLLSDTDEAI